MSQVLIGVFSGIFSGIGMGGGTILIFLLTTFAGLEQHIAQATNLIYFVCEKPYQTQNREAVLSSSVGVRRHLLQKEKAFCPLPSAAPSPSSKGAGFCPLPSFICLHRQNPPSPFGEGKDYISLPGWGRGIVYHMKCNT